jgi:hypothetical protein
MAAFSRASARLATVDGLLISSYGAVFRRNGRRVAQWPDRDGYLRVTVRDGRHLYNAPVHQLVAEGFVGPRPSDMTVNHIDGHKRNNEVNNLEYLSIAENAKHAARLGLRCGIKNANAKVSVDDVIQIRKRYATGETQRQIAKRFHISQVQVSHIVRRTRGGWPHIG